MTNEEALQQLLEERAAAGVGDRWLCHDVGLRNDGVATRVRAQNMPRSHYVHN